MSTMRLNEHFLEILEKLTDIMLKKGEKFRANAYQRAQETILKYPSDILSPEDVKDQPGIGNTIMEKFTEFVNTGTLEILEKEKNNPMNVLGEIYGVGPKKSEELIKNGITNIEQLLKSQHLLNDVQKIGLKYYDDILKRIPREEIEQYKNIFEALFNKQKVLTVNSHFEIVGSYRRGAKNSGDIDVIITSDNPIIFVKFIDELIKQNIILEILSRGPTKCLVISKISNTARRVDFLYTTLEEYPFSILYFTGSKYFNTFMRKQALEMGYTMNEHGMYKIDNKKKGDKIKNQFKNEKDIFDFLNMEYKTPEERNDGRAVIIKSTTPLLKFNEQINEPINEQINEQINEPIKKNKKNQTLKKKNEIIKKQKKIIIENDEIPDIKPEDMAIDFKKKGIQVLETFTEKDLSLLLLEANKKYYNETPFLTDNEFDIIKEFIEKKYPNNPNILKIGANIERNKVTLPYFMGSMNKIKPDTNSLANWKEKYKGPYVLSCKLDGVSALYTTEKSVSKLYTRGDGVVGQDISHLIPYLKLPKIKNVVIRGEIILSKKVFEEKYKTKFANARNMVSGLIHNKTINEYIKDLDFVAYEVIQPIKLPSEQFHILHSIDIISVLHKTVEIDDLTNNILSELLIDWRKNYKYEIDGIIVTNDLVYERKNGNPEHSIAFKMVLSDQIAEAKVVDVIWTASKDGYLKPRVQIEQVHLGGVCIEYATGFNGSFIKNNKIGIGSVIELIRSGDVIPYIRKVIVPAEEPKMPLVDYKWNDSKVDILLENILDDENVKEKIITGFFKGIEVDGLSSGNVTRICCAGYDSIGKILKMKIEDFLKIDGFKIKMATKLYDGIQEKIKSASLIKIMSVSNLFGRGFNEKKIESIMQSYPMILLSNESNETKIEKIISVKGIARKTAEGFVERINDFIAFLKETQLIDKLKEIPTNTSTNTSTNISTNTPTNISINTPTNINKEIIHPLYKKSIVMTGFRDKELENKLKVINANIMSSVSKNTFLVLVKNKEENTSKIIEAKKMQIPLMTIDEFIKNYNI